MEPQQGQKASDGALLCSPRQRLNFSHTGTFSGLRHTDDVKVSLSLWGVESSMFLREGVQSVEVSKTTQLTSCLKPTSTSYFLTRSKQINANKNNLHRDKNSKAAQKSGNLLLRACWRFWSEPLTQAHGRTPPSLTEPSWSQRFPGRKHQQIQYGHLTQVMSFGARVFTATGGAKMASSCPTNHVDHTPFPIKYLRQTKLITGMRIRNDISV